MDRIVVGVDAGPAGAAAVQWALGEAVLRGIPLTAVRAWSPSVYAMDYSGVLLSVEGEAPECTAARQVAEEQLKRACERVSGADTVESTATAVLGGPAQVLIDASGPSVVLVVGTRGHGALSRAVLGSVSAAVLHHAHGRIVVVPEPTEHDEQPARVLVGVDHSPASLVALAAAADEADRRGSSLVPVHVHEPVLGDVSGLGTCTDDPAGLEAVERRMLETACAAAGVQDVDAQVVVGHPGATLNALARPQDLLVVGSRGRGGFAALLLGSTSTQTAQHATCPVLVVRP